MTEQNFFHDNMESVHEARESETNHKIESTDEVGKFEALNCVEIKSATQWRLFSSKVSFKDNDNSCDGSFSKLTRKRHKPRKSKKVNQKWVLTKAL